MRLRNKLAKEARQLFARIKQEAEAAVPAATVLLEEKAAAQRAVVAEAKTFGLTQNDLDKISGIIGDAHDASTDEVRVATYLAEKYSAAEGV